MKERNGLKVMLGIVGKKAEKFFRGVPHNVFVRHFCHGTDWNQELFSVSCGECDVFRAHSHRYFRAALDGVRPSLVPQAPLFVRQGVVDFLGGDGQRRR